MTRSAEPALSAHCTNASISVLEVPKEQQRTQSRPRQYSIEHVDLGARYYQDHFVGRGDGPQLVPGAPAACAFPVCRVPASQAPRMQHLEGVEDAVSGAPSST